MSTRFAAGAELATAFARWRRLLFITGLVLLVLSLSGLLLAREEFFRSWLIGFLFCLSLPLGSLALLMLQYLTGGAWGVVARPVLEASMRTLPLLALFFLPLLFGLSSLFPWTHAEALQASAAMRHRAVYMNPAFWMVRAALYFAVWGAMSYLLSRWSKQGEQGPEPSRLLQKLSAPGLILYVFTITFASVDWAESLSSEWYSTMWGFLFVAGQGLGSIAFTTAMLVLLHQTAPLKEIVTGRHFLALGKLLLMFVMLWAYFSFSQLLIVWAGNLTSEIGWYLPRWRSSWSWSGGILFLFEFAIPFLLLLSKRLKETPRALFAVCVLVFAMRGFDLYWLVVPDWMRHGFHLHWEYVVTPLAMFSLWLVLFLSLLRRHPLLPLGAPDLEEAIAYGRS